jgi:hypothetical protein
MAACLILTNCNTDFPPFSDFTGESVVEFNTDQDSYNRIYERNIVFMTTDRDSLIIVPWLFRMSTSQESVDRTSEGWLAQNGIWESFFTDQQNSELTRHPFRVYPSGAMALVVGSNDVIEKIIYEEGLRYLEISIEEEVLEWNGSQGEMFRINQGAINLRDLLIEGMILDMNRTYTKGSVLPGEWMFLTGPNDLVVIIRATEESSNYTAWVKRGDQEYHWPDIEMEWSSVRSFEEARRDIPIAWRIRSLDGEMDISLTSVSMELNAVAGEGPILPVEGLHQVSGSLILTGDYLGMQGLVRHVQH